MGSNTIFYNLVTAFIKENIVVITVLSSIIISVTAWKVSAWKTKTDQGLLQIPSLSDKIGAIDKAFHEKMSALDTKVHEILGYFREKSTGNVLESSSPLVLNKKGKAIAEDTHLTDIANIYAEQVKQRINNENAYEIQEICFEYAKLNSCLI